MGREELELARTAPREAGVSLSAFVTELDHVGNCGWYTARVAPKRASKIRLPRTLAWLFPEVDLSRIDPRRDVDLVLTRVLERGRMADVEWCMRQYGLEGIRAFFRRAPRAEISARTIQFWRVVLDEQEQVWPSAPSFRQASASLWPG